MNRKSTLMWTLVVIVSLTAVPIAAAQGPVVESGNRDDGGTAMLSTNAALLKSVSASGDPHYIQMLDVNDFGTQRWDPVTFDTNVTSRTMG